jgi:hypothetical protein
MSSIAIRLLSGKRRAVFVLPKFVSAVMEEIWEVEDS